MNVLSLFDGMSCGQIALERAGINVSRYYAAELDKYAITVTQANYPDTIQLGDVTAWREWDIDWASIDLLIGGSPCQGFSFAGKQLAFDDPRSKLFFVYVDILNHIRSLNPGVKFLLENVKMKKEYLDVISEQLGVEPVFINSALVSAQNRQRFYWANWEFGQPSAKNICFNDIADAPIRLSQSRAAKVVRAGTLARGSQGYRIYADHGKSPCLLCNPAGGNKPIYFGTQENYKRMTLSEAERLQTVPVGYTAQAGETARWRMLGNGWTVDVVTHIFNSI